MVGWDLHTAIAALVALLLITAPVGAAATSTTNLKARTNSAPSPTTDTLADNSETGSAEVVSYTQLAGDYQPGNTVSATVTVENTGTETDEYYLGYSVQSPDGEWHSNDGTTGTAIELGPGERKEFTLRWTVQDDSPTGEYNTRVSVWENPDPDNPGERLAQADRYDVFTVENPTPTPEPSTIDATITDFDVDSGTISYGDTITGEITVENSGNTGNEFFVGFSAYGPDSEWYSNNENTGDTLYVPAGETRTLDVSWDAWDNYPTGEYDTEAAVYKESDRYNLGTAFDSESDAGTFTIEEARTVDATFTDVDIASGEYQPGDTVTADVTVENTGNVERDFYLGYSVRGPDYTWYSNNGNTGRVINLNPGERTEYRLTWAVPDDSQTGEYDARVKVWKGTDPSSSTESLDSVDRNDPFTVTKSTEIDAAIRTMDADSGTVQSGDEIATTVTVENTGNDRHTYYLGYSVIDSDWDYYTNNGDTGYTITLDPGERREFTLTYDVTEDTPADEYDAKVVVWKESDDDELETRLAEATRKDTVTVEAPFGSIAGQIVTENGDPVADATVTVGDGIETTTNENGRYELNEVPAGEHTFTVNVGDYTTATTVTVTGDTSATEDITLSNVPAEVSIAEVTVEEGSYKTDESVPAEVTVRNTGIAAESVTVEYLLRPSEGELITGGSAATTTTTIPAGETDTVDLSWTNPSVSAGTKFDAVVRLRPGDSSTTAHDVKVVENAVTTVESLEGLHVTSIDAAEGTYEPGDTFTTSALYQTENEELSESDTDAYTGLILRGPNGTEYDTNVYQEINPQVGEDRPAEFNVEVPDEVSVNGQYDVIIRTWPSVDPPAGTAPTSSRVDSNAITITNANGDGPQPTPETELGQVTISVEDESGDALTGVKVGVGAKSNAARTLGRDGEAEFDVPVRNGPYKAYYIDNHGRVHSQFVTVDDTADHKVTFTVPDSGTLSGTVQYEDLPVLNGKIELSNGAEATIRHGEFSFSKSLPAKEYTAVITTSNSRYDDGTVEVTVTPGENDVHLSYGNSFDTNALIEGAFAGRIGEEQKASLSAEYMIGWMAGGIFAVTDVRDAISAVLDGDEEDAFLSAIAIIPVAGDASGAVSKIGKYLHKLAPGEKLKFLSYLTKSDLVSASDEMTILRKAGYFKKYPESVLRKYADKGRDLTRAIETIDVHRWQQKVGANLNKIGAKGTVRGTQLAELTATRRIAKAYQAKVVGKVNEIDEPGYYVMGGVGDRSGDFDIDTLVLYRSKTGDTTIKRIYETKSTGKYSNTIDAYNQLRKKPRQISNGVYESVGLRAKHIPEDGIEKRIYVTSDGAKASNNNGVTIAEKVEGDDLVDVKEFSRSSKEFNQDAKMILDDVEGSTQQSVSAPHQEQPSSHRSLRKPPLLDTPAALHG